MRWIERKNNLLILKTEGEQKHEDPGIRLENSVAATNLSDVDFLSNNWPIKL